MAQAVIELDKQQQRKQRNKILGEEFYMDDESHHLDGVPTLTSKDKINKTAKGLTNDLLLGVIGGGLAGAMLGRYSFFAGLAIAGYGHYADNKLMGTIGLGMMASGTASALLGGKAQDSKATMIENVTERVKGFTNELKRKVWVNKWDSEDGLNGVSAVHNTNGTQMPDFTKDVNPIDPNKFARLSKEEEVELDKFLNNAGALAINQFYEKRHNLNGTKESNASADSENSTPKKTTVEDLEKEMHKATESVNKTDSAKTSASSNQNNSQKENSKTSTTKNVKNDFENDVDDELENAFGHGASSQKNYSSNSKVASSKKDKNEFDEMDVSDKLF